MLVRLALSFVLAAAFQAALGRPSSIPAPLRLVPYNVAQALEIRPTFRFRLSFFDTALSFANAFDLGNPSRVSVAVVVVVRGSLAVWVPSVLAAALWVIVLTEIGIPCPSLLAWPDLPVHRLFVLSLAGLKSCLSFPFAPDLARYRAQLPRLSLVGIVPYPCLHLTSSPSRGAPNKSPVTVSARCTTSYDRKHRSRRALNSSYPHTANNRCRKHVSQHPGLTRTGSLPRAPGRPSTLEI